MFSKDRLKTIRKMKLFRRLALNKIEQDEIDRGKQAPAHAKPRRMICYARQSGECPVGTCERSKEHNENEDCSVPCEGIERYHCVPIKAPAHAKPRPLCDACQYLPHDCDGGDGDYPDCYVDKKGVE